SLQITTAVLERVLTELRGLGGVPLSAEAGQRLPLSWSVYSATTQPEHSYDEQTGRHGPTGRVHATVSLAVAARAFDLLDLLGSRLAAVEQLRVHSVSWQVDADNPGWPQVRAAAIGAAIDKGRDYAQALGGSLIRVEHVADVGLLGGDNAGAGHRSSGWAAQATSAGMGGDSDAPSLDPVPQELLATIEARFTASVSALR
ncbi:MAG: SIMPL domain-containing protein, partial [Jatrophihabitans sp.]